MNDLNLPLTRKTLKETPVDFRIGAIVSDGMWYDIPKWQRYAGVTENDLMEWIDVHLKDGSLIQSPPEVGSKSYRMPLDSIKSWYKDNKLKLGEQLLDFVFPPRIWDGMTEVEGLETAPLREVGIVTFSCSSETCKKVKQRLLGVAKVREEDSRKYKAYCLSSSYAQEIIREVLEESGERAEDGGKLKVRQRGKSMRREMVDLTEEFGREFVMFYRQFGQSQVKGHQETIKIYLPDPADQEAQMITWVIEALEKFEAVMAVPFSGYFSSVLSRWPFNLPNQHLGIELSGFQRERSKALKRLNAGLDEPRNFTSKEISDEMGWELNDFSYMEERHRTWVKARNATGLTWDESSDEKYAISSAMTGDNGMVRLGEERKSIELASKLSLGILEAGIDSGEFYDAISVIEQLDNSSIDFSALTRLSEKFVSSLGEHLEI